MKKILSLLMLTACILAACTSVDDTLKPSDDIYVSVLETQDTVRVIPGDTVHFHFMVSTNNGAITRIEFVSDESIIEGHPEKMTFSLIDDYQAKGKSRFVSLDDYRAYNENQFLHEDTIVESDAVIKDKIDLVVGFTWPGGIYSFYSPANPALETYLTGVGITGYQAGEMHASSFYRIEGVGGHQLNDSIANETDTTKKLALINRRKTLDTEWFDTVDDAYLEQLDFSQAADYIEVTGGFYAIRTDDGRHGIIWVSYPNVFDNPIPITIERGIYQAASTE